MPFLRRRRDDDVVVASPPSLTTRDDVASRLQTAADKLVPTVRYATRRQPDAAIDIAQSKMGGAPELPKGTPWPLWTTPEGERRPLQFFAQVDLAEAAAAAPAPLGLPDSGLLSFFADFHPGGTGEPGPVTTTVMFSPADAFIVRCALRMTPLPTAHLAPLGAWAWPDPAGEAGADGFEQEYEQSLRARAPDRYEVAAHHQLGGQSRDGWQALLQLDSDDTLELAWGPGEATGRLTWTMPVAGISSGDWSGARFSLQA